MSLVKGCAKVSLMHRVLFLGCLLVAACDPSDSDVSRLVADVELEDGYFGTVVALEGETLIVTNPGGRDGKGTVNVYEQSDGWKLKQVLGPDASDDCEDFGASLALDDDTLAIGGGCVYVFEKVSGTWLIEELIYTDAELTEEFESYAYVAVDGDNLIVGTPAADLGGLVSYFTREMGDWSSQDSFQAEGLELGAGYGFAVAISGDRLAVGAFGAQDYSGRVYTYELVAGEWEFDEELFAPASLGMPWVQANGSLFGVRLLLRGDQLVVAAASESSGDNGGIVYVFLKDDDWFAEVILRPSVETFYAQDFGSALAWDGDTLAVGAAAIGSSATDEAGSVHIFKLDTEEQRAELLKVIRDEEHLGSAFGWSVGLSDGNLAVGAPYESDTEDFSGAAYVFDLEKAPSSI